MRIQHPKATDAVGGWPAAGVSLPHKTRTPITDGYVDVPDEHADAAMDALEKAYGVEYDRDSGEVVTDTGTVDDAEMSELTEITEGEICGAEMSDGSVCERPAGECSYHGDN